VTRAQLYYLVKLVDRSGRDRISREDFEKFRDAMRQHIELASFPAHLEDTENDKHTDHKGEAVEPIENNEDDDLKFEQREDDEHTMNVTKLRSLHPNFTDDQFKRLLDELNITGDKLSRDQFHKYQDLARQRADDFEYERLDLDGDGYLQVEELFAAYSIEVTRAQLYYLVKLVDRSGRARIGRENFEKFRDAMREHIELDSFPAHLEDTEKDKHPDRKEEAVEPIENNEDDDLEATRGNEFVLYKPPKKRATWQVVVKCTIDGAEVEESLCTGDKREAFTKIGCEPQDNP